MQFSFLKIFRDFRTWVILFFLIRLIGIINPPIEGSHNWRQCFTSMVTRNMLEEDSNLLYPRIDMQGGNPTDIVAAEFPIYNYLTYLFSLVFGYDFWISRLLNLIISSAGIYCFYLLVRRYFGERVAFNAGLIMLSSIWFAFSRKIMPDTFSAALGIMALYAASRYLDRGKLLPLLLFLMLATLGGLSKLPTTLLLSLIAIPIVTNHYPFPRRVALAVAGGMAVGYVALWYFHWQPYLLRTYINQLYYPFSLSEGIKYTLKLWPDTLKKFYFDALVSYLAFVFFLAGLFFMFRKKETLLKTILLLTFLIYAFFIVKTGNVFPVHNYYTIPFVPVMALVAGYGLSQVTNKKVAVAALGIILIEGLANQQHDLHLNQKEYYRTGLEKIADAVSSRNDKIGITGGMNPQQLYFAHRKGWILNNQEITDPEFIGKIKKQGCRFLFVNKHDLEEALNYPVVHKDEHYTVYKL